MNKINNNNPVRIFIAISLPQETKAGLQSFQGKLKKTGIKASWPKPGTLHLTLKFLGDLKPDKILAVKTCMDKAVMKMPVFRLAASGIGVFPSIKSPKIIWAGVSGQTDVLDKLVNRVENSLFDNLGFKKEKKKFLPHLTVARIKKPMLPKKTIQLLQDFKMFHCKKFKVCKITIFQSELKPSGAVHKKLFSIPVTN